MLDVARNNSRFCNVAGTCKIAARFCAELLRRRACARFPFGANFEGVSGGFGFFIEFSFIAIPAVVICGRGDANVGNAIVFSRPCCAQCEGCRGIVLGFGLLARHDFQTGAINCHHEILVIGASIVARVTSGVFLIVPMARNSWPFRTATW